MITDATTAIVGTSMLGAQLISRSSSDSFKARSATSLASLLRCSRCCL